MVSSISIGVQGVWGQRRLGLILIPLLALMAGCDMLPGGTSGSVSANLAPMVEFTNVPAQGDTFSYAPVIYWKGRDADGFVEHYYYADIIDATALADPDYYASFIPSESWIQSEATADTVYLITQAGQITEHVFYLKCVDDRGTESSIIHRAFYRSNHPPRVPEIKFSAESDTTYANDIPNPANRLEVLNDTLYCLDEQTDTWPGLGFSWKSSDPDDSELYNIPLQYRYYLEKVPHDTIWQWVSADWSRAQEIKFAGLETGHYLFTVWARDDGYEICSRPATATFDVYRPTFEQSVLLLNTGRVDLPEPTRPDFKFDVTPGTQVADFYRNQVLSAYPDGELMQFSSGMRLWKAYLGRFKLVIWFSETQSIATTTNDALLEPDLVNYVNIGGRLWVDGILIRRDMIKNRTASLAQATFAGPDAGAAIPQNKAEFARAISGVNDLPNLGLDTTRTGEIWRQHFLDPRDTTHTRFAWSVYPLLGGVDIFTGGTGTETAYYFSSYTDTASGDVRDETAEVRAVIDTIYYPPTAVDCIIALQRNRVSRVERVENISRQVSGTPISWTNNMRVGGRDICAVKVSYDYGDPWSVSDTVMVDYTFLPFSDLHMKPCAVRYEKITPSSTGQGYEVLYRVAVFAFPLYYMDDSSGDVTRLFRSMLNWFFLPYAH